MLLLSLVGVVQTSPKTFQEDVERLLEVTDAFSILDPAFRTIVKLNLSWSKYFPSCSTNPYTFDAVLSALLKQGYEAVKLLSVENKTVVTDIEKGLRANRWKPILKKHAAPFLPLTQAKWTRVKLKRKTMVLERMFGPIEVPEVIIGANVLHLPTVKTHGHSIMTGALKNAFGMLLRTVRHHSHPVIHEILVDLLLVQKELCKGLYTLTDGTIIGDGAGPRTMVPRAGNLLIGSSDLVAADAIQCHIMGINPARVPKLTLSQRRNLGTADLANIEVAGDYKAVEELPVIKTSTGRSPVIYFDKKLRSSFLAPLFHTALFHIPIFASFFYHDVVWYPLIGKGYINDFFANSEWGKMVQDYSAS